MVRGIPRLLSLGALCVLLAACGAGGSSASGPTLQSIAVTPANQSIPASAAKQFAATGTYSDGTSHDITSSVTWASGTTSVATIAASGLATAVAAGSSVISAKSAGVSGNTTLTITAATLQSIAITPANPSMPASLSEQFTATGTYSDGTSHNITSTVTWVSATTSVETISAAGVVSSVATGTSVISATSGSISGTTTLTVTTATLQSIEVTPANPSIANGLTAQFIATGAYSDGTTYNITSFVTWASGSTGVSTISSSGLATSAAPGTAVITATLDSISGNTTLTVTAATLQSVSVTPANPSISIDRTEQFTATGTYSDGTQQNITASVTWTSGTTAVATIAANGLATAVAAGTSIITATSGSISANTTLTVTAATLQSITVTPANPSFAVGVTVQLTATGTYSDGTSHNVTASVTWSSGTTAVATVAASGIATGVVAGSSVITATSGSISGSTTLMVTSGSGSGLALTILPGQVVSGVIDQNGGAASNLSPWLLLATGGNVGTSGYTWTVPPGFSVPFPSIVIQPVGVVSDASPSSMPQGTFTLPVEVSDGTTTITAQVGIDLSSVCNSSNGNANNPCGAGVVTNVHNPYLPNGTVGGAYAASIVTSGGTPPYTWVLGAGSLPPGITIDMAKGILRGSPTLAGTYNFFVLTTDAGGGNTSSEINAGVLAAQFTLTVN